MIATIALPASLLARSILDGRHVAAATLASTLLVTVAPYDGHAAELRAHAACRSELEVRGAALVRRPIEPELGSHARDRGTRRDARGVDALRCRPMYRRIWIVFAAAACSGKATSTSTPRPAAELSSERGGRAFDQWAKDPGASAATASAPPRLKDLFGWDLRGTSGVYGEAYLAKTTALPRDWLAGSESVDEIVTLLRAGGDGIPAYGDVLDEAALRSIALFITGVRDGSLARPDWIFELSPGKHAYTLRAGADPDRGRALFQERCADCHGADGTEQELDDGAYTLGSHARQKAYEDWFKILNGQPGTDMGRQVDGDGRAMAQQIHDLLAALCDRVRFPRGTATAPDVTDGDPRCGAYLH